MEIRKAAFVTGAGKVTGKAIALKFAEAGYDVGISYVNSADGAADAVCRIERMGRRAKAYKADARDLARVREVFADFAGEFGRFDALVNNAGVTRFKPFLEVDEEMFDGVFDTNLKGAFFAAQSAARHMKAFGNGGAIVNISSLHARGTWPGDAMYATTKAALNRLTEAMALDLAESGIRVVCVAPGYISTGWESHPKTVDKCDEIKRRIPLKRFADAGEIGGICVFLASGKAAYITGSTLYVEGGALLPVITENKYV